MDAVNWLLIHAANALFWLWGMTETVFGGLWVAFDAVVNPVLSPVLAVVNPICTRIGDFVYALLGPLPVWLSLTILSVLTGIVMLIAFRYTSNQPAIGKAKDDIKANLLALKLYKDELRVTFQAQGRLLWAILRLQRYMLTPVLVMLAPMLLGLAQMGIRHQWRPLHPGEQTLIRMTLSREAAELTDVEIEPTPGVVVEVGPVPGGGELVWRVRGGEPGRHTLRVIVGDNPTGDGHAIEKELVIGSGFQRVSAVRAGSDWIAQLLHPVERRLPDTGPARSIEILYPGVDSWIYGANWWVLYFFVVSMITALIFKPLFKVRF
ncbi:MAG: hypothetical protein WBE26_05395 [Phycisphaerae bacterium]